MENFFIGLLLALMRWIIPGALVLLCVNTAIFSGRNSGLRAAAGIAATDVIYTTFITFVMLPCGFASIISHYSAIIEAIGSCALLVLSWLLFTSNQKSGENSAQLSFGKAFMIALPNPMPLVTMPIAMVVAGVKTDSYASQFAFLFGEMLGGIAAAAALMTLAAHFKSRFESKMSLVNKAFAVLFAVIAMSTILKTLWCSL